MAERVKRGAGPGSVRKPASGARGHRKKPGIQNEKAGRAKQAPSGKRSAVPGPRRFRPGSDLDLRQGQEVRLFQPALAEVQGPYPRSGVGRRVARRASIRMTWGPVSSAIRALSIGASVSASNTACAAMMANSAGSRTTARRASTSRGTSWATSAIVWMSPTANGPKKRANPYWPPSKKRRRTFRR